MTDRSVEKRPSETALFAALRRTLAWMEYPGSKFGPDNLARYFLPGYYRFFLKSKKIQADTQTRLATMLLGMNEYMIARTAFFDQRFLDALREGTPQIVLLGAGYDSRAIRFADQNRDTRVFELDIAPTQNRKKRCLKAARIAIPAQVEFVPIDFNQEVLSEVLEAVGYQPGEKTLFLWEGVSYYLDPASVDKTLVFVSTVAPGSRIVFDYTVTLTEENIERYYGAQVFAASMREIHENEALTFSLGEDEIESFLAQRGLRLIEHLDEDEIERAFLMKDDGALLGRITGHFRFAVAAPESQVVL